MSRDGEGLPNAAETRLEWNKVIYQGVLTSKRLEIGFMLQCVIIKKSEDKKTVRSRVEYSFDKTTYL